MKNLLMTKSSDCKSDLVKRHASRPLEDTLVCVGLRRIVSVAFLRRVQIFLLTYLLTYL